MKKLFNWDVEEHPVYDKHGSIIKGYKSIVRDDNQEVLNVATENYYPIKNSLFEDIVGTFVEDLGCQIEASDVIKGGKKIFTQFKHDEFSNIIVPHDDHGEVEGYATLVNSHDGSIAFKFFATMIRMWCTNTFNSVVNRSSGKGFSVKHTRYHRDKIDYFTQTIEDIIIAQKQISTKMELMANSISYRNVKDYCIDLYNLEEKPRPIKEKINGVFVTIGWTPARYSTRGMNIMDNYKDLHESYTDILNSNWSLFNTTTHYIDHGLNKGKDYSLFGGGNDVKGRAFKLLTA